jgi:formylglycine-generating enzyme required for sulfatase activity
MSELNPRRSDLVLGGQNPPPVNAAVLGGLAGVKQRLAYELGLNGKLASKVIQTHEIFEFETVSINRSGRIITRAKKHAFYYTENLGNDVTLDMIYIPSGSFMMGSNECESEQPIHQVTLKSFYMAKYPTTQAQYKMVMGNNPSRYTGNFRHPVEKVSCEKAVEFCQRLSHLTSRNYTLPSESQWEYACRAGTATPFYSGETITTDLANYDGNKTYGDESKGVDLRKTTPVGKYPANPWGLYDMSGNVWELCVDLSHHDYVGAPVDGSAWTEIDNNEIKSQIFRGGAWDSTAWGCRSSARYAVTLGRQCYVNDGFRVVLASQVSPLRKSRDRSVYLDLGNDRLDDSPKFQNPKSNHGRISKNRIPHRQRR